MTIYNCEKCCFITENNYDYQKHIKTKKHLKNVGEIENVKRYPKVTTLSSSCHPKVTTLSSSYDNIITKSTDTVLYECDYCDATFKHRQNKYRHQSQNCKAKINQTKIIEQMEERYEKRIEHLEKLLDKAMKHINNTTNNNTVNNDHSRNLNITINAYGQEDLSYLKDGDWLKMLTNPPDSIVNLFLETHFNPEHPENSNIRLRNRNSKFLEIHDGDNWKNRKKKKMLSEIADDKQGILDDKFIKAEDIQNSMSERQKHAHSTFHDEAYYDNKKDIIEDIEAKLLD